MPWSLKEGEKWTKEMRQGQITRLEVVLPLKAEAIAEIKRGLERMAESGG
jgi:hypothetical protein